MQISGDGISTFTAKVRPDFRPETTLAIQWRKLSDGNYYSIDRGADADTYEASCTLHSKEAAINNFIQQIEENRTASTGAPNQITLSEFLETEHIFGEDVDHSGSISATVLDISFRRQSTFKGYSVNVKLRAISPTFSALPSLPDLSYLDIGYQSDNELTIKKYDTYSGTYSYLDARADVGEFVGTFTFSQADMGKIRRHIATERGNTVTITGINGVQYAFGPRRGIGYNRDCKIIDWEDMGMFGVGWCKLKIKLAEVI